MRKNFISLALLLFASPVFSQNVGIGTATPSEALEVIGNIKTTASTNNAMMGTHPVFGNGFAAWWRQGSDYT